MGNFGLLLAASNVSNAQAVLIGVGTVFVGLIAIILICKVTGILCNLNTAKPQTETAEQPAAQPAVQAAPAAIENRGELAAAVAAAIAEDLGTDVSGIRILSIKKS